MTDKREVLYEKRYIRAPSEGVNKEKDELRKGIVNGDRLSNIPSEETEIERVI